MLDILGWTASEVVPVLGEPDMVGTYCGERGYEDLTDGQCTQVKAYPYTQLLSSSHLTAPYSLPLQRIPVLYAHGGGFVAASAAVLLQSITPLAREGTYPPYPLLHHPPPPMMVSSLPPYPFQLLTCSLHCTLPTCQLEGEGLTVYSCDYPLAPQMPFPLSVHTQT